jgi:hypothetical protein
MATAKKAKVTAPAESKKAAPRRKPTAAATKKSTTASMKASKASPKATPAVEVMHEDIERLAYQLWEERGRPEGNSLEDWTRAQEILLQAR